jgi:hypothetical protein
VLVKGSHNYQAQGTYDVTVYITGPDGQSTSATTGQVTVTLMPDAASIPPDVPTSYEGSQPLGVVDLSALGSFGISSDAGAGFSLASVALISGTYNGQTDTTLGDYHAQINWGDDPTWDTNTALSADGDDVLVEGSHTYTTAGTYDVTVYVTGPDGQTTSATTAEADISANPMSATLSAPNVTGANAASEVPYNFSIVFQNSGGLVSGSSISGATVQVVPPGGQAITAMFVSTDLAGNTDGSGDASTIAANYQITPPGGDWSQAPEGTYRVNLSGSPVTGVSGGQVPQGSVGTFQVSVGDIAAIAPSFVPATEETPGEVTFGYTITGMLPQQTVAALYWAPTTTFDASVDTLAYSAMTGTSDGTTRLLVDPSELLAQPPAGTRDLLTVVDPGNLIAETNETNNVAALSLISPGSSFPVNLKGDTINLPPLQKGPTSDVTQFFDFTVTLEPYTATFTEQTPTEATALGEAVGSTGDTPRTVDVQAKIVSTNVTTPPVSIGINTTVTVTLYATAPASAPPPDHVSSAATGAKNVWLNYPYTPGDRVLEWSTPGFTTAAGNVNTTGPLVEWLDLNKEVPGDTALTPFETLVNDAEQVIEARNQVIVFQQLASQFAVILDPGNTSLLTTDPAGALTGVMPDGSVVANIPLSVYLPTLPAVFIIDPGAGSYTTQVRGLSAGSYDVVTSLVSPSKVVAQSTVNGSLGEGQTIGYSLDLQPTAGTLSVAQTSFISGVAGTGTAGGTAVLTATLTAGGMALSGESIAFTLSDGGKVVPVGTATTNQEGVATLSIGAASLEGFHAGVSIGVVGAMFAGNASDASSIGAGNLNLAQATPPVIISEQPIFERKLNKRGKPVGKAFLSGFSFGFSEALNPSSANDAANYQVDSETSKRVKKKVEHHLQPITGFSVSYDGSSDSVRLTFVSKQTFPGGGQITVIGGTASGITGSNGAQLAGSGVFTIAAGGRSIRAGQLSG